MIGRIAAERMDNRRQVLGNWPTQTAAALLFIYAIAKLISAAGSARAARLPDPVFGVEVRQVLLLAGIVELCIVVVALNSTDRVHKGVALLWVAANILVYRVASGIVAPGKPCACAGSLTKWLPMSDEHVGWIAIGVLGLLFLAGLRELLCEVLGRLGRARTGQTMAE